MNSIRNLCIYLIGPFLPESFKRGIYLLTFRMFQVMMIGTGSQVWYRNSLLFNKLSFGISDIDISAMPIKKFSAKQTKRFRVRYFFAKKILKLIGELNFFDLEKSKKLAAWANPFELDRDPKLLAALGEARPKSEATQIVFFLRMILSDRKNLFIRPQKRLEKWLFHFDQLGLDTATLKRDHFSYKRLVNTFYDQIGVTEKSEKFKLFGKLLSQDVKISTLYMNKMWRDLMFMYMPQEWIKFAIVDGKYIEDIRSVLAKDCFSKLDWEIFAEQLNWEVWGLCSQYQMSLSKIGVVEHLANLEHVLKLLDLPHLEHSKKGIVKLKTMVQNDS